MRKGLVQARMNRRLGLMLWAMALSLVGCASPTSADIEKDRPMLVYFGTYTKDQDEGIFRGELDRHSGKLTILGGTAGLPNPSFLTLDPAGRFLYAVSEGGNKNIGSAAFAIDPDNGDLTLLNTQPSGDDGACHISVDPAGTTAIVSNYGGGSVRSFPIQADGSLGPIASFIQHADPTANPDKKIPRAHCTKVDPTGRFALTADLGLNQVIVYQLDPSTSQLTPHVSSTLNLPPGAGPRHLTFHPGMPFVYLINEHDATITTLQWDVSTGKLKAVQTTSTLPKDYQAKNATAEIVIHPNGQFLYGSNRGHDSIVIYAIDPATGLLSLVGFQQTGINEPRNFNIDPTGKFLIACNQHRDNVQVFRIDPTSGKLSAVGDPVAVPMPTCVTFLPR